jgi:hypothetical protein
VKKYHVVWCGGSRSVGNSLRKAVKLARTLSSHAHAKGTCVGQSKVFSEWSNTAGRSAGQTVVFCRDKVCKRVPGALESGRERAARR